MPFVKDKETRIKTIDYLLSKGLFIESGEQLRYMVNRRLPGDIKPVSMGSINKDLGDLKNMIPEHIRILDPRKSGGGYRYSEPGYSYYKHEITQEDKNLMMFARSLFSVFKGTPLQQQFNNLVNKIVEESEHRRHFVKIPDEKVVQIESGFSAEGAKWISDLLEAIHEEQCLVMQYKSGGKELKTKVICPYVLREYRNCWYLVAYDYHCGRTEKTNVFSLDNIKNLTSSKQHYFKDPDFDANRYFKYSIGVWHWHTSPPVKVKLEFHKEFDAILSNPIHHSQKAVLNEKGDKLIVEIEVFESPELIKLIQSFGPSVKILSPSSVIKNITKSANEVFNLYRK